jgi:hypothetical protein
MAWSGNQQEKQLDCRAGNKRRVTVERSLAMVPVRITGVVRLSRLPWRLGFQSGWALR